MKLPKFMVEKWRGLRRKNRLIVIGSLLLIGTGMIWFFLGGAGSPITKASAQTEPAFQTSTVRRGNLRVSIIGSGTLVANQLVDLSFSTRGTVVALNVKLGDQVTAGQELASLGNSETLEANLANAELSSLEARQAFEELQENANLSLAQAYSNWVTAKVEYEDALRAYQRMDYARCSQAVNTKYAAELERVKDKLDSLPVGSDAWIDARNDYDTALANYTYCHSYTEDEKIKAEASLGVAKANLDKAESNYTTLKETSGIDPIELAKSEAKVIQADTHRDQAVKELAGITLIAPIDGVVTYLAAGKGSFVDTASYLTLSDVTRLNVQINVDETDLEKLALGSEVEVVFDALPDLIFTGKVIAVEPQLEVSNMISTIKGLVELDADAAETLRSLPLGLNGTVEIIKSEAIEVLWVPIEAVRDLGDGLYGVFVVESDGELHLRTVEVGLMDITRAEIIHGLSEGEVVSTGLVQTSN